MKPLCLLPLGVVTALGAQVAVADYTVRFTGAIVETLGGSIRPVEQFFDRTDPDGQGSLTFDKFPPESDESRHMRVISGAGRSYLKVSSYANFIKNYTGGGNYYDSLVSDAYASFSFDDVVISGPPGNVSIAVNIHLSGSQTLSATVNGIANSSLSVFFYKDGSNVSGARHAYYISNGALTNDHTGFLLNFDGDDVVKSDTFSVPANTPFKLEVGISANASASSYFPNSSSSVADTDFSHTLTLATDRPVFQLPAGYTANSAQAGIVNNTFSLPCPGDFNHDNQVDDADFLTFVVGYNILDCADPGMTVGCPADLNTDHFVDDADFIVFVAAYNALLCP
ncbi:MAG: hypothetical protein ACREJD_16950 [Phycisphaerales bacterium]